MRASMIAGYLIALVWGAALISSAASFGGELVLGDGTVLKGGTPTRYVTTSPKGPRPDPEKSYQNSAIASISEGGAVRFFVSRLFVTKANPDVDLRPTERFKLDEVKRPKPKAIDQVAGQLDATPWDKHGHRSVSFRSGSKPINLMQEIVDLTPKYAKVTAMDYQWEFAISTKSIPDEALDQILHQAIKPNNPDDRLAIARFYLEGEFYLLARKELESIRNDFPDQVKNADAMLKQLNQYLADQALGALEERREAGQYQFAYDAARKFLALKLPDISPATMLKLQQSVKDFDTKLSQLDDIRVTLGQLQGQLPPDQAAEVAPLRRVISDELHISTIDRLAPFLDLVDAEDRKPAEKLALALTGWLLGADQADTDLKAAIRLWQARSLLIEYFRAANSAERDAIVEKLSAVESVGPRQVARLIPLLPPRVDVSDISPGVPVTLEADRKSNSDPRVSYDVLLPLEYHPARSYPIVVVLHAEGMEPQAELKWWARQAQRFGYIVLAPSYVDQKQRTYDYGFDSHHAVLETIRDARRRFNVNSDRIFLGGHGMGGDATFDIGYSHPDIFAGIMPITAMCEKFSTEYWVNAKRLPQFVISGELDRTAVESNAKWFDHMMVAKCPLIYAVYHGRGHEDFHSEDERLFDWMARQKRAKPPLEIDVKTMRTTDNQFWWWKFSNFPAKFGITSWPAGEKGQPKPVTLNVSAKRLPGGNVIVLQSPAKQHSLWLYPEVVSFEKPLVIRQGNVQIYKEIPEPDFTAMLEDFRLRGDRQQIAWAYLELGSPASRPALKAALEPANRGAR